MKKTIKFKALYWDIAADLFFPANFDENKKYPVIISTHPIGSCKEQTSGNIYGQALADAGFIVLVPDASFQGESGGNLRYLEDPSFRVEDYSYACDYLVTLPFVDENRIGALGICGAGGYVINATMKERRIKAVATLTGANYGRVMREFGDPIANLEAIAAQRTAEARGETLRIDQGLYPTYEMAKEAHADIDILEATEYYRTSRGEKTNGVNKTLFSHNATAITWDAYNLAEKLLTQPLLVIVGSKPGAFGAYRDGFEIIRRAASKKKELVVVNGWSHYDLYDKPEPVKIALDKLIPFYKENL
ncbi:dienelactone hydrolase and related enzymes [Myroides odoratimimus]|uniref:alpha/beta hydrolase n=1 Tax=Myroides odoratimimus TaxID=76832 RepID=UPI00072850BC|nr:alpha/beta hydrolase [Myroides odoratimimus]GAQ15670.1 dienelactone hydrolase and related enzymes [Myroides odoratimimus]